MNKIRVLLVDDHLMFLEGLSALLSAYHDIEVVGEATDGETALVLAATKRPDVVVMDVRMPILDGVAATKRFHTAYPNCRVILLTTFDDDQYVYEGIKAGAVGYLLKNTETHNGKLVEAIHATVRGETVLNPGVARKVIDQFSRLAAFAPTPPLLPASSLSEREREIVHLLAQQRSNRDIADRLGITEGTVKRHISNILAKLSVTDRAQAVRHARLLGII